MNTPEKRSVIKNKLYKNTDSVARILTGTCYDPVRQHALNVYKDPFAYQDITYQFIIT